MSVDNKDGYIRGIHTAPANESETIHLQNAVAACDFKPARVYADKGYASASNRTKLRAQRIKSAIMHRAYKNKPLTAHQIKANKISSAKPATLSSKALAPPNGCSPWAGAATWGRTR